MTRDETRMILQRRLDLTGDNFNAGMLDAWHDELVDVDYSEAVVAMRRAARKGHVRIAGFLDELHNHQAGKQNAQDRVAPDCCLCDGTGWREGPRVNSGPPRPAGYQPTTSTVEPCTQHVPHRYPDDPNRNWTAA